MSLMALSEDNYVLLTFAGHKFPTEATPTTSKDFTWETSRTCSPMPSAKGMTRFRAFYFLRGRFRTFRHVINGGFVG